VGWRGIAGKMTRLHPARLDFTLYNPYIGSGRVWIYASMMLRPLFGELRLGLLSCLNGY